ncbi:MAG: PPC domain-containing protein, partial [Planctomycetales bacterium]|nr:PPC domain-containing protein [Planctomycetales bacterium]
HLDDATLVMGSGQYSWGNAAPRFDLNLIGKGIGQTIVQGQPGSTNVKSTFPVSLYFEGISFLGGDTVVDARNGVHFTAVDAEFANSTSDDGLNLINFSTAVLYRVSAHDNWRDGLSYHNPSGSPMEVLEAYVSSVDNGKTNEFNSQGSTTHDSVNIVRVASEYRRNRTNIADVSNATSWNVDVVTSHPTDPVSYNFYQSNAGTAWLISGNSSVGGVVKALNGATIRYSSLYSMFDESTQIANDSALLGPDNSQLTSASLTADSYPSLAYDFDVDQVVYVSVAGFGNTTYDVLTGGDKDVASSVGRYLLQVSAVPSSFDGDDQIDEAIELVGLGNIAAALDFAGDVDLYAIDVVAGQILEFDLDVSDPLLDLRLTLFDESGNLMASVDDALGNGSEGSIWEAYLSFTFSESGRYYLGVSSAANDGFSIVTGLGDVGAMVGSYQLFVS